MRPHGEVEHERVQEQGELGLAPGHRPGEDHREHPVELLAQERHELVVEPARVHLRDAEDAHVGRGFGRWRGGRGGRAHRRGRGRTGVARVPRHRAPGRPPCAPPNCPMRIPPSAGWQAGLPADWLCLGGRSFSPFQLRKVTRYSGHSTARARSVRVSRTFPRATARESHRARAPSAIRRPARSVSRRHRRAGNLIKKVTAPTPSRKVAHFARNHATT